MSDKQPISRENDGEINDEINYATRRFVAGLAIGVIAAATGAAGYNIHKTLKEDFKPEEVTTVTTTVEPSGDAVQDTYDATEPVVEKPAD